MTEKRTLIMSFVILRTGYRLSIMIIPQNTENYIPMILSEGR